MLDSNGSFDNPFFQDKKIVKIDCKWKGQEYSNTANGNSYCNTNLSSNEYRVLWESGRIFISIFLYEHICICTSVNTGYIIYLPNKRAEEKINH